MAAELLTEVTDFVQILRQWEEEHSSPTYDPIPVLQRLADIIELEIENYMKMDPDPFDERHPSRTDPECNFGHILKVLFRKDNFMTKVYAIADGKICINILKLQFIKHNIHVYYSLLESSTCVLSVVYLFSVNK